MEWDNKSNKYKYAIDKEWLANEYLLQKRSICNIAKEIGCDASVIGDRLKYYNIETRDRSDVAQLVDRSKKDMTLLRMGKYNKRGGTLENYKIPKEELYFKYIVNGRGITDICKDYGCNPYTIKNKLNGYGITLRTSKVAHNMPHFKNIQMKRILRSQLIMPNKPEHVLIEILNTEYNGEWKYVGDGEVVIGGKFPDIINCGGYKAVIELNGTYWHSKKVRKECPLIHEIERIKHFEQYGYNALVIWQHELKYREDVIKKLRLFYSEIELMQNKVSNI